MVSHTHATPTSAIYRISETAAALSMVLIGVTTPLDTEHFSLVRRLLNVYPKVPCPETCVPNVLCCK